ncbi:hypothetical protein Tco_0291699 [Tanacetum coccineum]
MRSLKETIIKFCKESIRKQTADDKWIRKSIENTDSNIRELKNTTKNMQEKAYELTQTVLTNTCEKVKARTKMGKESLKAPVPSDLPPTSFLGHLKEQIGPIHDKEEIVRDEKQDYNIPLHDGVMQPLTPQTVHITPPDDDYVAPATSPTLDKQLNEFMKECFNITRVAEMANG